MMKWFKNLFVKKVEDEVNMEYLKEFCISIDLMANIDNGNIYEELDAFFKKYFKSNPLEDKIFTGLKMMSGPAFLKNNCNVKIIFQENVVEFLTDKDIALWKTKISEITSLPIREISNFVYWSTDDEYADMERKMKFIDSFKD